MNGSVSYVRLLRSRDRAATFAAACLTASLSGGIALAATTAGASVANAAAPPYPPSPVIRQVVWAPAEDIIRLAPGGDTWPMTWADDGHLYTAYGDAHGFEPLIETKLSMGLGRVEGFPPDIRGMNLRSEIEARGAGPRGRKASGMLMVDGILYMLLRNDDRQGRCSRLAWSRDHGKTWTEADWRFEDFGYPTFVNFGRNYAGARDDFVYIVSHDHASAYHAADRFNLTRVPKDRIRARDAYEFFVRRDEQERPVWTRQIGERGTVFEHAGRCYRSGISYNAGLGRYIWSQIIPSGNTTFTGGKGDVRFEGGFGVYDAPEPWGPWTTVFYTEKWDVGPGETSSFPPKWMSADGRTAHLVFSGDDCFSVRKVEFVLPEPSRRR
jgi:hypothetical protein